MNNHTQTKAPAQDDLKKLLKKQTKREARAAQMVDEARRNLKKARNKLAKAQQDFEQSQNNLQTLEAELQHIRVHFQELQGTTKSSKKTSAADETPEQVILQEFLTSIRDEATLVTPVQETSEEALAEAILDEALIEAAIQEATEETLIDAALAETLIETQPAEETLVLTALDEAVVDATLHEFVETALAEIMVDETFEEVINPESPPTSDRDQTVDLLETSQEAVQQEQESAEEERSVLVEQPIASSEGTAEATIDDETSSSSIEPTPLPHTSRSTRRPGSTTSTRLHQRSGSHNSTETDNEESASDAGDTSEV